METICASVTTLPKKQRGFRLEAPCFYGCGGPQPDPPTGACKAIERTSNGLRDGRSVMRQLHFHRLGPAQTQPGQDKRCRERDGPAGASPGLRAPELRNGLDKAKVPT
jgi:hypothetical protein